MTVAIVAIVVLSILFGLAAGAVWIFVERVKEQKEIIRILQEGNEKLVATALESRNVQYVDPAATAERLKAMAEHREKKKRIARVLADLETEHKIPKPEESKTG